ncbi:MAG: heavy metal translocating P-type ATPase [Eubacterium sp.]|nr:heavy metal translocating P-type ATPase [Eubacterium sp.]
MTKYDITGMSCAACSARVEKAVSTVDGVDKCNVNLLTNSMAVEGKAGADEVIKAVENAGYGASVMKNESGESILKDTETKKTLKRLILSVVFLVPLMYLSMGHHVISFFPTPMFKANRLMSDFLQMVLSLIIIIINRKFFINGFKGVIHKAPNMDTLVALGSGVSFVYSVYLVIIKIVTPGVAFFHLYFESAAMILTLITVGKLLEAYSKGRTTSALKGLIELAPKTAKVIRDGEEEVPISYVVEGSIFVVRSGDAFPVDGVIIEGDCSVDESSLTGESIPVDKTVGDTVSCATISTSGYVKCRATRVGSDTTLSQIVKMVSDASATKAPIAKIADKVSGVFVPIVIIISIITTIIWLIIEKDLSYALTMGITVLVISCPCALGLATPVAIMVGSGIGAKNGILFKTAGALEQTGKTQIAVLDKTGTITEGRPEVCDIIPFSSDENELIKIAYSLEEKSEHPLAGAIVKYGVENDIDLIASNSFKTYAGSGVSAQIEGKTVFGGSLKFISEKAEITSDINDKAEALSKQGKTPLFFSGEGELIGIIAVADTIKKDSEKAISELKNMGIRVVMLTGDNKNTAQAVGALAGVDAVVSDVLPGDKQRAVASLKKQGRVAMAGDGINDAPALTSADIGVAINAGSDIAIDAADVVLMNSSLLDLTRAIRLSRATVRNIRENLFWAFIYNVIGITLAAGVWINITGWTLNPMFGAAAMSLSSFCVVTNALRLNLFKIKSDKRDKRINPVDIKLDFKEKNEMKKVMKIEGMMCPHCEAAVKGALEALDGVALAEVSHERGEALVTLSKELDSAVLKKAVEDKEYKVISIA